MFDHVGAHIVRPLHDLGSDIYEEGVRRPPAKDHYLMDRVVVEEESHRSAGAKRVGANVVRMKAEGLVSSAELAGGADLN